MPNKNILVIGAGPAGASAAFFLKSFDTKEELDIDLVDMRVPSSFSKYHRMCGEAISSRAFEELAPIKPTNIIERIKFIEEFYPGDMSLKIESEGYILNRSLFLHDVINKFEDAGGNFQIKKAQSLINAKNKVSVNFQDGEVKWYDYVIAADGAGSVIRNSFGLRNGEIRRFIQYIVDEEPDHNTMKFFYDESYNGDYKWIFPNGNTTKIGYPIVSDSLPVPPADFDILEKHARTVRFGLMKRHVFGRTLAVGDAACQINPLTKGGIRPAMNMGKIAAEAVFLGDLKIYETACKESIFFSKVYYSAFDKLRKMSNRDLSELVASYASNNLPKKYGDIPEAFKLSEEYGW